MSKQSGIFYGWWIVAAAFVTTFAGFGSAYTFGAFLAPLQEQFAATRGTISLIFSLAGFIYFLFGAVSGSLADRLGARILCITGACLVAAGMVGAATARTLPEVLVAYGLGVGLGVGCAYVPVMGVVQRWFLCRRGLASGIAVSGIGAGTLAMPPFASLLIADFGWRDAYLILAGVVVVFGVGAALILRDDPGNMGLTVDGKGQAMQTVASEGLSVARALRSKSFGFLYVGNLLIAVGAFVPFVHLVPFAENQGVDARDAVWLVALAGAGSALGRPLLGVLADRIGRARLLVFAVAGMGAMLGLWAMIQSFASLACFAIAFGIACGGWVALLPAWVADLFGRRHISGIIGLLYTSVAFGTLVGPVAVGFLFDRYGNYRFAILACVVTMIAGALLTACSVNEAPRKPKLLASDTLPRARP